MKLSIDVTRHEVRAAVDCSNCANSIEKEMSPAKDEKQLRVLLGIVLAAVKQFAGPPPYELELPGEYICQKCAVSSKAGEAACASE